MSPVALLRIGPVGWLVALVLCCVLPARARDGALAPSTHETAPAVAQPSSQARAPLPGTRLGQALLRFWGLVARTAALAGAAQRLLVDRADRLVLTSLAAAGLSAAVFGWAYAMLPCLLKQPAAVALWRWNRRYHSHHRWSTQ